MNKIQIIVKTHYGTDHIYIVDPEIARHVKTLTGCKTISKAQISALIALGFEIEDVTPKLAFAA